MYEWNDNDVNDDDDYTRVNEDIQFVFNFFLAPAVCVWEFISLSSLLWTHQPMMMMMMTTELRPKLAQQKRGNSLKR